MKCQIFLTILVGNLIVGCNTRTADDYFKSGIEKYELDNDYEGAIEDYNEVIKVNPKHLKSYINRGASKYNLQDYKGAIEDFNKAIEINPLSKIAYFNKAAAKSGLEDHRGAIEDYSKAIEIDWKYCDIAELESQVITFVDFRRIISLSDTSKYKADSYSYRGNDKEKLQDYAGAVEDYTKAIEIEAQYGIYYAYRGLAKIKLGQKDSGCLDLSKSGELGVIWAYDSIKKYCQ